MEPAAKYAIVLSSDTKWESKLLASVPIESNVLLTLRREDDAGTAITTERDEYNRTCSLLLYRPVIPTVSRLSLAERQAGSAIALLRQGEREKIFSELRVSDDPESLTQFVHRCRARGVSPGELWESVQIVERTRPALRGDSRRLEERVMFGLLLALGEFSLSNIPVDQRDSTVTQLATWYRADPSSTIHGVTGWLLRLGLRPGRLMASVGMRVCLIATDGFKITAVVRHIFHARCVRTLRDYSTCTGMWLNGATIGRELRVDFRSCWRSNGLEPRVPWRQLGQRGSGLPVCEPLHVRTDVPDQLHGVPAGPESV